jgi:DNA repair protein RecN (Recombination protein N)
MPGGEFRAAIDFDPSALPTVHGLDTVEFRVSANPGQPLKPLGQVASGGELSRISLAIQVITANSAGVPTLIFDEVDSGIGGGTAEVVGRLLRQLGLADQVLCVTHLPQVAAQAHNHLQVNKTTRGANTRTSVQTLVDDERVQEVARMLGGVKLTEQSLSHAREMIELAAAP